MLKYILYISFISTLLFKPSILEVRELYKKGADSKEVASQMHKELSTIKESDGYVLVAYKAAALTLIAKHAKKIVDKKEYFKRGAALLEKTITAHPNDIEVRFIRLSIQQNSPKILKYKDDIEKDKSYIFEKLTTIKNKDLKSYIKTYVLESNSFSTAEKNVISGL